MAFRTKIAWIKMNANSVLIKKYFDKNPYWRSI